MHKTLKRLLTGFIVLLFMCGSVYAENTVDNGDKPVPGKRLLTVPYPFFNDTIGSGIGVAAIAEGYIQPQVFTVGSGLVSTEGTYLLFMMMRNYQFPWMERLFLEPAMSYGNLKEIKFYGGTNSAFPNERPGGNDSHEDNFTKADGTDGWFDFNIKYLLPIGHGRDSIITRRSLDDGILISGQSGGKHWNPMKSGKTYIELEPFFRTQKLDDSGKTQQKTSGIEVALTHDNTDFPVNPSKGSFLRVFFDRDWGAMDSTAPWSVWGGEFSHYFDLGPGEYARQRVIAFNFWSAHSPTWNSSHTENGQTVMHRPPTYKGANLGGLWRMRGYQATRFNDASGIYYGLEYRHMLKWNPMRGVTWRGIDVDWFQLVAFGEMGRVAPDWELDTLHEDMKFSAGGGLRMMVNNLIIRLDLAGSEEDMMAQLFIGQPWPKR